MAVFRVRYDITNLLAPRQLGFNITSGAEAAVHAATIYVHDLDENCILKIDFRIAFNMLRRDKMLLAMKDHAPGLIAYEHSVCSTSSTHFWGEETIQSKESVQQGDPLGPLLFCLMLHKLISRIKSEFCVWYPDDGMLVDLLRQSSRTWRS